MTDAPQIDELLALLQSTLESLGKAMPLAQFVLIGSVETEHEITTRMAAAGDEAAALQMLVDMASVVSGVTEGEEYAYEAGTIH